ncbi:13822_t:CDS:2, partial [Acaulospora colombiana]
YGEVEYPDESAVNILAEAVKNSSEMTKMDNYAIRYPTNEVFSRIMRLPIDHLIPIDHAPVTATANRPYDCHLLSEKLAGLGIDVNWVKFEDWWKNYLSVVA